MTPNKYKELLHDNITKDYQKTTDTTAKNITTQDKKIPAQLDLDDRIDITAQKQAFITLKDHKDNFHNIPKYRLINPTKSEIGKISKQILENINAHTRTATKLNQWKNTNEVIAWYNNIDNKHKNSFLCFEICEFYPSITEELLHKALDFASRYITISDQDRHIIIHKRRSLLYDKQTPWHKMTNPDFDVTMGSYDGAETFELVGLYLLSQLQHININVGLYRDDGLTTCKQPPRRQRKLKQKSAKYSKTTD